jgi:putative methionine-R-sulfoxide reductase with GAF domain
MTRPPLFRLIWVTVLAVGAVTWLVMAVQSPAVLPLVTGMIAAVLAASGAAVWLTRRLTAPVAHLAQAARQIQTSVDTDTMQSSLGLLSDPGTIKELADLAAAFEQMATALQQRTVEWNSIYAMSQAITANVDFEQTVQAVLAAVQQVVIFDAAEVTVARDDRLIVEAWRGQQDFNDTTGREYRIGRGPTGMIAASRQTVLVSTLSGNEEDLKRTLGYESASNEFVVKTHKVVINSFLGIPLLIGERLIGTLTLVHREPGRFTERDKRQLNKLAAQASIAIDNAVQVRKRESALQEQIRELRVEVDQARLKRQVDEITGSDYFQQLQARAAKMRERVYTKTKGKSDPGTHQQDTESL